MLQPLYLRANTESQSHIFSIFYITYQIRYQVDLWRILGEGTGKGVWGLKFQLG